MTRITSAFAFALTAASLAVLLPAAASAVEEKTLFETCFVRSYDTAHLARHPAQSVTEIQVYFQEFEDGLNGQVTYKVRGSEPVRAFAADCSAAAKASDVLTCAVCKGDSCETTGDRFKIRLRDRGTIELLNNDTGVTATVLAGGESEGTEKLAAGGEHGSFLLKKAALKACGR